MKTNAKSQVLADFVVELTTGNEQSQVAVTRMLFVDGASSRNGLGIGVRLLSPAGKLVEHSCRLGYKASNNEAEYEALLAGLRIAASLGIENLIAHSDSQLVTSQCNGEYEAKDERMKSFLKLVKEAEAKFKTYQLLQIPRLENSAADALAALASKSEPLVKRVIPVEYLEKSSI